MYTALHVLVMGDIENRNGHKPKRSQPKLTQTKTATG